MENNSMSMKNRKIINIFCLMACLYITLVSSAYARRSDMQKLIFGRKEEVLMFEEKFKYKAKLDTGAKTASLLALNIQEFEFDGKLWVSFQVLDPRTQDLVSKEFPLERHTYIKQHHNGNDRISKNVKRPVILLPVCLGRSIKVIEVNLVDRRHFKCPVLLGRDAIVKFNAIVDPSKMYTSTPNCEAMS